MAPGAWSTPSSPSPDSLSSIVPGPVLGTREDLPGLGAAFRRENGGREIHAVIIVSHDEFLNASLELLMASRRLHRRRRRAPRRSGNRRVTHPSRLTPSHLSLGLLGLVTGCVQRRSSVVCAARTLCSVKMNDSVYECHHGLVTC